MPRRTRNSNASSETVRSKPRSRNRCEFFGQWQAGRFRAACPDESGLNTIFSSKRPMSSGRKNRCSSEMTARSSVVKGRRVGRKKLLRADVARAHDVETRKIISSMVGERDAGCIEHLQEEIPYQAMGLFDFVEEAERLAGAARERFPSRPALPVSSPMNSFTLSRCRNSDISKRKTLSSPKR